MSQANRSLVELCRILDPHDLCVENLEDSLFDQALPLIEQHGTSICFDVGHLAWQGISELDFLARHHHRIREIHLHDVALPSAESRHQIIALARNEWGGAQYMPELLAAFVMPNDLAVQRPQVGDRKRPHQIKINAILFCEHILTSAKTIFLISFVF